MKSKLQIITRAEKKAVEERNSIVDLHLDGPLDALVNRIEMEEESIDMVFL